MLKFPLKVPLLLMTDSGILVTEIQYAGRDTLKVTDVKLRQFEDENFFEDVFISDSLTLDRTKVFGYSKNISGKKKEPKKRNLKILHFEKYSKKDACNDYTK